MAARPDRFELSAAATAIAGFHGPITISREGVELLAGAMLAWLDELDEDVFRPALVPGDIVRVVSTGEGYGGRYHGLPLGSLAEVVEVLGAEQVFESDYVVRGTVTDEDKAWDAPGVGEVGRQYVSRSHVELVVENPKLASWERELIGGAE